MDRQTIKVNGNILNEALVALKRFTADCRPDMHEPDEQGISARVIGDHLDNAMGLLIRPAAIEKGYQEFVVILMNDASEIFKINLADLIALARHAEEE